MAKANWNDVKFAVVYPIRMQNGETVAWKGTDLYGDLIELGSAVEMTEAKAKQALVDYRAKQAAEGRLV
jgi:hypothetical protein